MLLSSRVVLISLSILAGLEFAGCGGGGNDGGGTQTSPTITSVRANCTPSSIQMGQTSQCSASISGTGNYSTAVTWSATDGSVTSAGVFSPSGEGSATVTATSTADSSKSGSASVTVSSPPTVSSVSLSCSAIVIPTAQSAQCSATVQGTGDFSQSVTWSVDNVLGGNSTLGLVDATGLYTAPAVPPSPFLVSLTASSVADPTKSASFNLLISGTLATASQTISASAGGILTLPDGSSATIPGGILPADQTVTLTEASSLPYPLPNQFVTGAGTALILTFSSPLPAAVFKDAKRMRKNSTPLATAGSSSSTFNFNINQEPIGTGLDGAIGLAEIIDSASNAAFAAPPYTADSQTSSLSVPTSLFAGLKNGLSSIAVSAANITYSIFDVPSVALPETKCWQTASSVWTDFSNCKNQVANQRVLVVVHGMMSCVEGTFSQAAEYMLSHTPAGSAQGYGLVVGFDYDWTQHLTDSGSLLSAFLEQLLQDGASQIDILAHSEGVPVALYAASQTPSRSKIQNLVGLGGPILGTPIALQNNAFAQSLFSLNYTYDPETYLAWCPASEALHGMNFLELLNNAPFVQDLQLGSPAIKQIQAAVASTLSGTTITLAGGESPGPLAIFYEAGSPFGITPNDGIVGLDSALGFNAGFQVHPFPPFPTDFHTDLPKDQSVLNHIFSEMTTDPSPALQCNGDSSGCAAEQTSSFKFTGDDFGQTDTDIWVYSQDSTGAVTQVTTTNTDSSGSISWTSPGTTEPLGSYSVFAFNSILTLTSDNIMQTVTSSTPIVAVSVNPEAVTLSPGASQTFTASVTGTTNVAVTWSIEEGTAGGEISAQGVYTAPNAEGTYHVIAASVVDANATGIASVTVNTTQTVTITPASVSVPTGAVQTFSATVPGGGTVTWGVEEGAAGGSITSAGVYTAPSAMGTYHVIATSSANSTLTATATVTVVAAPTYFVLNSFPSAFESAGLVQGMDGDFYGTNEMYAYKITSSGTISELAQLSSSPSAPISSLIQATDGYFYGVNSQGNGSIFKIDNAGTVTTLYTFPELSTDSISGIWPWAGIIQATDGNFYGTTYAGGNQSCVPYGWGIAAYGPFDYNPSAGYGCGTIFEMDASGNLSVLYSFSGQSDGNFPQASMIQGSDGYLYGTTSGGGAYGFGTVFKISLAGNFQLLHSFSSSDGSAPVAALIQASDGYLYGTAACVYCGLNGSVGMGEVFKLDTMTGNNFSVLHIFSGPDGSLPVSPLVQANDGNFYGTSWAGGDLGCGTYYFSEGSNYPYVALGGCGTVFRMDTSGEITVMHTFEEPQSGDGDAPYAGLIQGKDGYLYGTTYYGGTSIYFGTVFKLGLP